MERELIAATTFGLEAVVKREIEKLGYRITLSENGRIGFMGDERAIVRANLWLRCADRILLKIDSFEVTESEELFQRVRGYPWEEIIPLDGKFTVTCSTVKSELASEPNNQKTVKKAIALRLADFYAIDTLPETGAEYTVKISLLKNQAMLTVDTTGTGLFKRGYKEAAVAAPLKETLAAALVQLSFWKEGRLLVDPCCGSGTIPIEAAMIGRNIAPGLMRHFAAEEWDLIDPSIWKEERARCYKEMKPNADLQIFASDIDGKAIEAARANAEAAGVDDCIEFKKMDAAELGKIFPLQGQKGPAGDTDQGTTDDFGDNLGNGSGNDSNDGPGDNPGGQIAGGIIITNPPYGQRIGEKEGIERLYDAFGSFLRERPDWSLYLLTADKTAEERIAVYRQTAACAACPDKAGNKVNRKNESEGKKFKADRRRKLYNGRMEVCYYQYYGQKPGKRGKV